MFHVSIFVINNFLYLIEPNCSSYEIGLEFLMMNSLVSYESSDEDEEVQASDSGHLTALPSSTVPAVNGESLQHEGTSTVRSADDVSKPMIGPMVGPTALNAAFESKDDDGDDKQLPEDLSEQDLVRFLTQASHPITELPPSPSASPNPQFEAKFKRFLELKSKGLHFNEDLAKKASFRNPALLSTLMSRAGLDNDVQYATSLPTSLWDPQSLPSFGYKEALLKTQQTLRDQETAQKKQASATGKRTIEFAAATQSGPSSNTSTPA